MNDLKVFQNSEFKEPKMEKEELTIGDLVNEIVDYLIAKDITYIEALRVIDECNAHLRMKRVVGRGTCGKLANTIER